MTNIEWKDVIKKPCGDCGLHLFWHPDKKTWYEDRWNRLHIHTPEHCKIEAEIRKEVAVMRMKMYNELARKKHEKEEVEDVTEQ